MSGPLLDRIDLHIDVAAVHPADLASVQEGESSARVAARVLRARQAQEDRAEGLGLPVSQRLNSRIEGKALDAVAALDAPGKALLEAAARQGGVSARGWTRALRLARTIADLEGADSVRRPHLAEALVYRRVPNGENL